MLSLIIVIISILLDGLLSNILPYTPNALSLFTPMLTIVSLILIYPLNIKKEQNYYITAAITGLVYDLLYTNLLFYNAIIFLGLAVAIKYMHKYLETNCLNIAIYTILTITLYEVSTAIILVTFNLIPITIGAIFYKIIHSLLLNIIYVEIVFLIIKLLPKKYKKVNIN